MLYKPKQKPKLQLITIKIQICDACLQGEGDECHTPGCALYLHHVDLPIHPESYEVLSKEKL